MPPVMMPCSKPLINSDSHIVQPLENGFLELAKQDYENLSNHPYVAFGY